MSNLESLFASFLEEDTSAAVEEKSKTSTLLTVTAPPKKRRRLNPNRSTAQTDEGNDKTAIDSIETPINGDLILREIARQQSLLPYHPNESILLFGDGDFSFTAALARLGFTKMVATVLEPRETLIAKYPSSKANIAAIGNMQNTILFEIDISDNLSIISGELNSDKSKYDKVIFNYPHSGIPNYDTNKSIASNQRLLRQILEKSLVYLRTNDKMSELHITLKSEPIYNSWHIQKQLTTINDKIIKNKKKGDYIEILRLKKRKKFDPSLFFGYHHKTTVSDKMVGSEDSYTWIFGKVGCNRKNLNKIKSKKYEIGATFKAGMYRCELCNEGFNSEQRLNMHLESKKHAEKLSIK